MDTHEASAGGIQERLSLPPSRGAWRVLSLPVSIGPPMNSGPSQPRPPPPGLPGGRPRPAPSAAPYSRALRGSTEPAQALQPRRPFQVSGPGFQGVPRARPHQVGWSQVGWGQVGRSQVG